MKIALVLLLIIHALIHLLGFFKAFEIAEVKQLSQHISKSMGLLWLFAGITIVAAVLLFLFENKYWWILGIIGVVISQILIIGSWNDAKFGTIANIILLITAVVGFSTWSYFNKYRNDVALAFQQADYFPQEVLTEADIIQLPEPVKKYMRYTGCIGKPKVNNFKIEFSGKIRKDEQSEWMNFRSEQYNFMNSPTRLFFMNAVMKKLPVAGYHAYKNGIANMDIRLFSMFKVQYMDGEKMNKAETVTFFNDMCCMAPATLIDKRIQWLNVIDNKVEASFTNNNITIKAWLYFNDAGELINFTSDDRYSADAGKELPWSTPLKEYKEYNGYKIASSAQTIYSYPEGDLCYGTFNLTGLTYNTKE